MKKILLALLLLALPLHAQYAHRSNPGDPGAAALSGISVSSDRVCADTGGGDTLFVSITGTWNATLSFVGTNDNGVTTKALMVYPFNASGGLGGAVGSTTANGDWQGPTSGFRKVCVVATVFTSNTSMAVRIDADPGVDFVLMEGLGFNGISAPPRFCDRVANVVTLGTTATVVQITGVAAQHVYVCTVLLNASTAAAGTTISLVSGSGAACVTGLTVMGNLYGSTPTTAPTSPTSIPLGAGSGARVTNAAGDSVCLQQGQTVNSTLLTGSIFYTIN